MGGIAHGIGRMFVVVGIRTRGDGLRVTDQRCVATDRKLRRHTGFAHLRAYAHPVGLDVLGIHQPVFADFADSGIQIFARGQINLRRLVVVASRVEAELQIGALRPPADLPAELAGILSGNVLAAE
ncbi:hypothetical protein D9M71_755290 [compost metagenome]